MAESDDLKALGVRPSRRGLTLLVTVVISVAVHVGVLTVLITLKPDVGSETHPRIDVEFSPEQATTDQAAEALQPAAEPVRDSKRPAAPTDLSSERVVVPRHTTAAVAPAASPTDSAVGSEPMVLAVTSAETPPEVLAPDMSPAAMPEPLEDLQATMVATIRLDYLAWLERFKQYPLAARRRGVQGVVMVRFEVDQMGRLQGHEMVRSSGSKHLDRAALELLSRAAPFPELPRGLHVDRLEIELPIEYRLRDG